MISCHSGLQNLSHKRSNLIYSVTLCVSVESPSVKIQQSPTAIWVLESEKAPERPCTCTVNWGKTQVQVQQRNDSRGLYVKSVLQSCKCDLQYMIDTVRGFFRVSVTYWEFTGVTAWPPFSMTSLSCGSGSVSPTQSHSIHQNSSHWLNNKNINVLFFPTFLFFHGHLEHCAHFLWQLINENNSEHTVALQWYQAVATKHVVTFCLVTVETQQLNTASYRYFTCICFKGVNTSFILNGRESRDHFGTFIQRQVSQL